MKKILKASEQQSLLRDAFKRLVDEVKQKAVVDAGLNQTVASGIYHGRKGIGDETIEKLDASFPDWRTIKEGKTNNNSVIGNKLNLEFLGLAEFKRQLNHFFDGMSAEHKEAIVLIANKLHDIDQPNNKKSRPFPTGPTKQKEKQ
jgi:hypothetical protein